MQRSILGWALLMAILCVPSWGMADDQQIAQQIADSLSSSGRLQQYSIGVKYKEGTAWLSGHVTSEQQLAAALQVAKQTPHVKRVVNQLEVSSPTTAQASKRRVTQPRQDSQVRPASAMSEAAPPVAPQALHTAERFPGPMPVGPAGGGPLPTYVPGTGGGIAPAVYDQPHMPNYAWPSYASHPNYAALTYPKQYSATAWPFIGPFYPYPQVPLGWRKVTLEWDDGWWFLDFKDR